MVFSRGTWGVTKKLDYRELSLLMIVLILIGQIAQGNCDLYAKTYYWPDVVLN